MLSAKSNAGHLPAAGAAILALIVTLLLGACGPTDRDPTPSLSYGSGPITEAQYVGIVRAVRQCMVDKGYDVNEVKKRPDGVTFGFTFSGGAGTQVDASGKTVSGPDDQAACEQQYGLMEAELAIQDQNAATGAEREATFADFAACLDTAGVHALSSADTVSQVQDKIARAVNDGGDGDAAGACWTQYKAQLFGSAG